MHTKFQSRNLKGRYHHFGERRGKLESAVNVETRALLPLERAENSPNSQ
jgi:hypothetical protein